MTTPRNMQMPPVTPILPSNATLAFAIAVVQSKPPELAVAEYIDLLRKHVVKGRRQNTTDPLGEHMDRSSYWRFELERAKGELSSAQEESTSLRIEIEKLKSQLSARPPSPNKKRKKQDGDIIPYPRSPKRQKRETSPMRHNFSSSVALGTLCEEYSQAGEIGNILLHSVFQVHSLLKRPGTDPTELGYHIVKAASAVPQIINRDIEALVASEELDMARLRSTLTVASRAVTSILIGFNGFSKAADSTAKLGKVIHPIVGMFKTLLDKLECISGNEIKNIMAAEAATRASKKSSAQKSKVKAKSTKPVNVKENLPLSTYTMFLSKLVDVLDPKVEANKKVFEGMAYCVLDKLGKRLYCTVFGQARPASLESEILQSNKQKDKPEGDADSLSQARGQDLKQATLEAPYLVYLLNRLMIAAPSFLGSATNNRGAKIKTGTGRGPLKGALAVAAKECLQRTLVNSVFGTDSMDESDPFLDCLKMPPTSDAAFPMPRVKDANTEEWFKEEVWRLLGWEILEQDGEWLREEMKSCGDMNVE